MAKGKFQIAFDENLKRDANLPTTERLAFDDLGDFIEERERIKRDLERRSDSQLRVDYSDFSNHVFFDSAVSKLDIAAARVLNKYPYNDTREAKDAYSLTGSGYEQHIFNEWPRYVGYTTFSGSSNQYISGADTKNTLLLGTSSLQVSAWILPSVIQNEDVVLQRIHEFGSDKVGYEIILSGATDPHIKFNLYSGSSVGSVSASYVAYTSSFNSVSAVYNATEGLASLYINAFRPSSASVSFNSIDFPPGSFLIGSGTFSSTGSRIYSNFSGAINEVRVLHTASQNDLIYTKNYSRPIMAENYVKLHYKFNEGITEIGSIDSFIVDYSQNALHGRYKNFAAGARVSGSVLNEDPGDPILYAFHSDVVNFTSSLQVSASLYDDQNNNQIFNLIGENILSEDIDSEGLLSNFSLAMARFFDDMKLHIDQFVNLRITNYDGYDDAPDIFLPHLKRYFGWKVSEHFGDANPLEYLYGEQVLSSGSLTTSLSDIKNQFWRRILNNLPLLMKSKGTRTNLDHFFNLVGVNRENISVKEYGYLPGGSIQDDRIAKQRVVSLLGIGTGRTGSLSSSYVAMTNVLKYADNYSVEILAQLPFASASYTSTELSGQLWQMHGRVGTIAPLGHELSWERTDLASSSGSLKFNQYYGGTISKTWDTGLINLFDGDLKNISAGLGHPGSANFLPWVKVRTIDGGDIVLSVDTSQSAGTAWIDFDYGDSVDLIVGAASSSVQLPYERATQGYFGEFRFWKGYLSSSEADDHALNFQSIGRIDSLAGNAIAALDAPGNLVIHQALDEDVTTDVSGQIYGMTDLSRNQHSGTAIGLSASFNSYKKFLHDYNPLSPTIDLKWTENKIRIRDKTELKLSDIASDTNEVSLEFNLVDALNEDIVKIFSSLEDFNNLIGEPVMKYRDEYSDLEGIRRRYFERMSDTLNFTQFFGLFKWFDKQISDAIKQLLPTRVKFIGGEQVIESHMLERPKYKYQYPIFRTPPEVPEANIDVFRGNEPLSADPSISHEVSSFQPERFSDTDTVLQIDGNRMQDSVTTYGDGETRYYRSEVHGIKVDGDTKDSIVSPVTSANFKNWWARKSLKDSDAADKAVRGIENTDVPFFNSGSLPKSIE